MKRQDVKRRIVTTNVLTVKAQKNYESVGFKKKQKRLNLESPFAGKFIDYEMILK